MCLCFSASLRGSLSCVTLETRRRERSSRQSCWMMDTFMSYSLPMRWVREFSFQSFSKSLVVVVLSGSASVFLFLYCLALRNGTSSGDTRSIYKPIELIAVCLMTQCLAIRWTWLRGKQVDDVLWKQLVCMQMCSMLNLNFLYKYGGWIGLISIFFVFDRCALKILHF